MQYESIAVKFIQTYPVGSTVTSRQLLDFAKNQGDGLATDLLIADTNRQVSTIRRHLNTGGASYNLSENERFQIVVKDAKYGTMITVGFAEFVREIADKAVEKAISGAMSPLHRSRKAINGVKLDELDDGLRKNIENKMDEIIAAATPMSRLCGEIITNDYVKRLVHERGYTEESARQAIEMLPLLAPAIKLLKLTKF